MRVRPHRVLNVHYGKSMCIRVTAKTACPEKYL